MPIDVRQIFDFLNVFQIFWKKKQHIKINYILFSFYFQTIIPEVIKQNQAEYCISRFQKCNLWCQHTPIFTFLNWICKYKNYSDINFFSLDTFFLIIFYLGVYKSNTLVDERTWPNLNLHDRWQVCQGSLYWLKLDLFFKRKMKCFSFLNFTHVSLEI